jgi:acetoacetate decarboxylase
MTMAESTVAPGMPRGDPDLSSPVRAAEGLRRMASGRIKLWEDARFVLVDVPLDAKNARRILPPGMWLDRSARATLFIVNYTKTSLTVPYREAALLIRVGTLLGRGVHCAWMVVDDDTALIYGRELLGYPKKLAEIRFEESQEGVEASVARRGGRLVSVQARRGAAEVRPEPVMGRKTFNVGGLGQATALNPVWMFRPREVIREAHAAQASLELFPSDWDPIERLVSGPALSARLAVIDIVGSSYMVPVGFAGPGWFTRTAAMRYR